LIDGEAVCCDDSGLAVFAKLRHRRNDQRVLLRAFDLLELDGKDLRREPLERRKVLLMRLLAGSRIGLEINDHIAAPMPVNLTSKALSRSALALPTSPAARAHG
jgi:bifunctional non-homologous end joining protein LigD